MSVVADRRLPEREQLLKPHAAEPIDPTRSRDARVSDGPASTLRAYTGVTASHDAPVLRPQAIEKRAIDSRAVLGATVFASPPLG